MKLSAHRLSAVRGQRSVLRDVNLTFDKPELIGLIGPNGAGKSTLMRALSGLQSCAGSVVLNGQNLNDYSAETLARLLAFLPQERTVHWPMDCQDIVMLGRMPYQSGLRRASDQDRLIVRQAMAAMEVVDFAERPFDRLSGGEQARVLIARVLAQEPELIIADEPINGLDPAHQISLMKTFRQMVQAGRTVLTSLHDLALASHWCDRIIILNDGALVADGPVKQVMTEERIRAVYGVETITVAVSDGVLVVPADLAG